MPYLLIKTTLVAVILGLFACFTQAREAAPRFTLNEVTRPALPAGYGRGYGGYGGGYSGCRTIGTVGMGMADTVADTAAGTVDMGMADTATAVAAATTEEH